MMKNHIKLVILLVLFVFYHTIAVETNNAFAEDLAISNITGQSYLENHIPLHAIDDDPATYWQGDLLEFDMGEDVLISQVSIAFLKGDLLKTKFEIQVSADHLSWTKIFVGTSSGTTIEQETFILPETSTRHVRLVGFGDNIHSLNRIIEVSFSGTLSEPVVIAPVNFLPRRIETTQIEQYGIKWTFAEPVQYGQFANGDYWVIDKGKGINIINISPGHKVVDGRTINGSMVNPPYFAQGYDSLTKYTESLNVGIGISVSNPKRLTAGDSLVSSISVTPHPGGNASYLKTAAVLTCLDAPPLPGSFRPGYSDPNKTLYNKNSIDYSLLKTLPIPASAPSITSYELKFQRVWLDHLVNYANRMLHPVDNMQNYGRDIANVVGNGALLLHLDYTNSEKEKLLINFIQVGIDLFGIIQSGGKDNWIANGGHESGRKWPILFAGMILNEDSMKSIGSKSGDYALQGTYGTPPADYIHFAEDDQTFYVSQNDVDCTSGITCSWNPDSRSGTPYPYTSAVINMPEWGIRALNSPSRSDMAWYAIYRHVNGYVWSGFILAARFMNAQDLWNNPALFDYMDRYMAIAQGKPDPFGFNVPGEQSGALPLSQFQEDMWITHRQDY